MASINHTKEVGAPDPELKTSPIIDDTDEETLLSRQQVPGEPYCLFNSVEFPSGSYIKSGSNIYRCDYGIWTPSGPADTDNP